MGDDQARAALAALNPGLKGVNLVQSAARLRDLRSYLSEEFGYDRDEDREAFSAALDEIESLIEDVEIAASSGPVAGGGQVVVDREDLDRVVGYYFDGEYERDHGHVGVGDVARSGARLRAALASTEEGGTE